MLGCFPAVARAGMPSIELSDVARMRVQTISFFLAGLLLSSWLVQLLWNYLRKDCVLLPRLSYGKALGVVVLWGLLFVLVLTMISGARELMTPGAWEKQGLTYRLTRDAPAATGADRRERERREQLDRLRAALWEYAQVHGGAFPPSASAPEVPGECWLVPGPCGLRYHYVGGLAADQGAAPLAYEPGIYGAERLVLLTNGEVRRMTVEELLQSLPPEGP